MDKTEPDRIGEVFKNRTLFISGGTGFFGKMLVEKMLRCTEVKKVYLLVREKRGKSSHQRIDEIFNNVCFSVIKEEKPEVLKKCSIISGDVIQTNLGISSNDRDILKSEVEIIIHSAATTRFDDTVKYAVHMNTRGTKYMLDLAKACKHLKLFIHVSTAYAFPKEKVLYEKFYDPPANPDTVIDSIDWIKETSDRKMTQLMLGDVPNTYTFSKAMAEELVRREVGKIPAIVVRPSIIIPSYEEPMPGWFQNLQGPMGILVGAGKGVIRTMHVDGDSHANLIPVDSAANATLVAAWDFLNTKRQRVYNLCMPKEDLQLTWREILETGRDIVTHELSFNWVLWYPGGSMTKYKTVHNINFYLFQLFPAIIVDTLVSLFGYDKFLYQINMRIYKSQEMFDYYCNRSWDFDTAYSLELRKTLNPVEKSKYKVEEKHVDIRKYFCNAMLFGRRHILKEPDEWLPSAKRNMWILYFADRIIKTFFLVWFIQFIYNRVLVPIFGV